MTEPEQGRIRVLFVCMGNICRSPTAEGVFKQLVAQHELTERVTTDSAGTHDYHIGAAPDPRAQEAAARRGYDLSALRARRVTPDDFKNFDLVLAMDTANRNEMQPLCPDTYRSRLRLFLEFAEGVESLEVPDPYYGGPQGFEEVLDLVEKAASGLLSYIKITNKIN